MDDGNKEKDQVLVDALEQTVAYCETFHLIDKRNGVELWYVLGKGGSKTHGWTPKISFQFFNITLNNAYWISSALHKRLHQQDSNLSHRLKPLTMDEAVGILCWSLLQKGDNI